MEEDYEFVTRLSVRATSEKEARKQLETMLKELHQLNLQNPEMWELEQPSS